MGRLLFALPLRPVDCGSGKKRRQNYPGRVRYTKPKVRVPKNPQNRATASLHATKAQYSTAKYDLKLVPNLTHVRSSLTPQQELLLDHCVQKLFIDRLPDYIIGSRTHQRVCIFIAKISGAPNHQH
jgi:hypothetical protein